MRWGLGLFGLALLARIVHLWVAQAAGTLEGLHLDSGYYAQIAKDISMGQGVGEHPYLMSPMYPYLLSWFTDAQGELHAMAVRYLQAVAGALTTLFISLTAACVAGRRVAILTGLLTALYGPLLHYDAAIVVASLQGMLLTAALWVLVRQQDKQSLKSMFGVGLLLGLSATLRPTGLALVVAMLALLWLVAYRQPTKEVAGSYKSQSAKQTAGKQSQQRKTAGMVKSTLGLSLALCLGALLPVLPFTVRNIAVSGEAILLSANSGVNFYIGNQPGAMGVFKTPKGYSFPDDPVGYHLARHSSGEDLNYGQASAWWKAKAYGVIAEDPVRWLVLMRRKAIMFCNPKEISQLGHNYQTVRKEVWTLGNPLTARYLLFLALLAPSLLLIRGGRSALWRMRWPLLFLLAYAGAICLFFITARYRISIMPVAIALASTSLLTLWDMVFKPKGHSRELTFLFAVGLALLLLLSHSAFWARTGSYYIPDSSGTAERQEGMRLYQEGKYAEAVQAYQKSLALSPHYLTRNNMANALKRLGRYAEAKAQYEKALAVNPDDPVTLFNFGNLWVEQFKDLQQAEKLYRRSLQLNPRFARAHYALGIVQARTHRTEEAIQSLQAALQHITPREADIQPNIQKTLDQLRKR